jgi:hypothetical protein
MFKIASLTPKLFLFALAALLAFLALPISDAAAAGLPDDPQPGEGNHPRLKIAFRRLERRVERMGNLLDRSDALIEKAQTLIDRAAEKGLDASGVQAALDALAAALPNVQAAHAEAAAIAAAHAGFDDDGNVTDPEAAQSTVEALHTALQETRAAMDGTGKALIQAIRDFLKENRDALRVK